MAGKRGIAILIGGALCAAALSGVASAQVGEGADSARFWRGFEDHPGGYSAKGGALNAAGFLPPPPLPSSSQGQADQEAFVASRTLQGSPRWVQATADNEIETPDAPFKAFADALQVRVDPKTAPTLTLLLGKVLGEIQLAQHELKTTTFRPRPFVETPAAICIAPEPWLAKSSSYPSGHSATGWTWALVLASLAPDRREAVLKRGLDYGESRAVCGVHFRSDVEAGRVLGGAVFASLSADPAFQRDLAVARAELAKVRGGS